MPIVIYQAVFKVEQHRVVSFVQLPGFASRFWLYKENKFQIMPAMAAFNTGDFRFRAFNKKCNNIMDE